MYFYTCKHFHYVLSMGAVFAIFSGFYYWFGKLTGYLYSETLGKIHFWITFIGVNVTFFPMHILGLSGMPRRIPDYPDMYSDLNLLCSIGSLISFFGVLLWFFIIFLAYYKKVKCPKNPWVFYSSVNNLMNRLFRVSLSLSDTNTSHKVLFKKYLNRLYGNNLSNFSRVHVSYNSMNYKVDTLEWVLDSPPQLHSFVVSPKVFTTSKKYYDYRYKRASSEIEDSPVYNTSLKVSSSSHFTAYVNSHITTEVSVFYNSKFEDTNLTYPYNVEKVFFRNLDDLDNVFLNRINALSLEEIDELLK